MTRIAATISINEALKILQQRRVTVGQSLAPPPGRRTRPGSNRSPARSSAIPLRIVGTEIPVARAVAAIPHAPHTRLARRPQPALALVQLTAAPELLTNHSYAQYGSTTRNNLQLYLSST